MNIRPAIPAPSPRLSDLLGRVYGKKKPQTGKRRAFFRMPRSLSFTRQGLWFTGVALFIGISAVNTGNNLMYLVLSAMLSVIIVSGVMSESTLRKVRVSRSFPRELYKGTPALVRYTVTNGKKLMPSFSFTVRELPEDGLAADPVYMLKAPAGRESVRTSTYTWNRRGRFLLTGLDVSTRFPFGLFRKGRVESCAQEVVVYPSLKVTKMTTVILRGGTGGDLNSSARGDGTEIYGLRFMTENDDARFIHWKSAARTSRLLVKEFEEEKIKTVFVVFKNYSVDDPAEFEDAVDEAAAAANVFIQQGYFVGLKTLSVGIDAGAGRAQLLRILDALAVIAPASRKGTPRVRVENA